MLDKKNEGKVEKSSDAGRISGAFFADRFRYDKNS